MALEKQDSGVCLSTTEPNSPSEPAGAPRPLAFFVDLGDPTTAGATRKTPTTTTSSLRSPASPRDGDPRAIGGGRSASKSTTSPRTVNGTPGRPQEDARASTRRSSGQRSYGASQKSSTKVYCSFFLVNVLSIFGTVFPPKQISRRLRVSASR